MCTRIYESRPGEKEAKPERSEAHSSQPEYQWFFGVHFTLPAVSFTVRFGIHSMLVCVWLSNFEVASGTTAKNERGRYSP